MGVYVLGAAMTYASPFLQLVVLFGMGAYAWWAVSKTFEAVEDSS